MLHRCCWKTYFQLQMINMILLNKTNFFHDLVKQCMFLCPIAQNRLNAHNENKLRTNFDNLKKTQSMILYLLTNPSLVPDFYCLHNKRKPHHALSDLKKNTNAEAGNTNCLFSTFFATTEMLKHLNTGKKGGWHHHLRLNFLFLFFFVFFFHLLSNHNRWYCTALRKQ